MVLLSPFEIHFSQTRIRPEFQDGRSLAEALAEIQIRPLQDGLIDGNPEVEDISESGAAGDILLAAPFPRIEVTRWRCKLRDSDGAPKLDPSTGLELYSHEEKWFSFDNRRLCCLQKAAAAQWPQKARCEVLELPHSLAKTRELRKFDTRTFGYSVLIGRREDPNPEPWCWRTAVGIPQEEPPEEGIARQSNSRWRRPAATTRSNALPINKGRRPSGRRNNQPEVEEDDGKMPFREVLRNAMLFFLIYLLLRICFQIGRRYYQSLPSAA